MYRQTSEYFRGRKSHAIVQETRGVPLQILSLLLGLVWFVRALQFMFLCDQEEGTFGWTPVLNVVSNCREDPYQMAVSSGFALQFFLSAGLRWQLGTAERVADMYNSMMYLVFIDFLYTVTLLRIISHPGATVPSLTAVPVAVGTVYEVYVFYLARKAYLARLKMRKIEALTKDE